MAAVDRDDVRPVTCQEDVNIVRAFNICDAVQKININKIIFASSVAVFGLAPSGTDEFGESNYVPEYGLMKYLAARFYRDWRAEHPMTRSLTIVRPTVISGKEIAEMFTSLLRQAASKRFVMFGDGKNQKQWLTWRLLRHSSRMRQRLDRVFIFTIIQTGPIMT